MFDKILAKDGENMREISLRIADIQDNYKYNATLMADDVAEKMLVELRNSGQVKTIEAQANNVISAKIDFNINYNAGVLTAGQSLLLELPTNANRKVVFHSSCGDDMNYRTRIFYVENNQINIIEDSQNLLGSFDVDSFISPGGTYYIQIDILSGSANLHFLVVELEQYSDYEPCDNVYDALNLTPTREIDVMDFFDNRMDYDIFAMEVTSEDVLRFKEAYLNFGYMQENLVDPYKKNVRVSCMILIKDGGNFSIAKNMVLPASIVDYKIKLDTAGTYYFVIAPYDALPVGQLVEKYKFSVTYAEKFNKVMLGGDHSVNIAIRKGSLGEGTYDSKELSSQSPFWINGVAVHFMGSITNWAGSASQLLVRVNDMHGNLDTTALADIDATGNFSVAVPLNKYCEKDFEYHGEQMMWNYISFIDYETYNRSKDVDSMKIIHGFDVNHLHNTWGKYIKIGVCYNDARLNK